MKKTLIALLLIGMGCSGMKEIRVPEGEKTPEVIEVRVRADRPLYDPIYTTRVYHIINNYHKGPRRIIRKDFDGDGKIDFCIEAYDGTAYVMGSRDNNPTNQEKIIWRLKK